MELRLASTISESGTIPLSLATSTIGAIRDLILSSATFETTHKGYSKKRHPSSMDIFDNFVFNQTTKGSFIFNIQTNDLSPNNDIIRLENCEDFSEPMERKVIERIQFTLQHIEHALLYKDISKGIKYMLDDQVMKNMNANICDAIITIFDSHEEIVKRESTIHLSPLIPAKNTTLQINNKVSINSNAKPMIKLVSDYLKASNDEDLTQVSLTGQVQSLSLDETDSIFKGTIKIEVYNHAKIKTITAPLISTGYNTALDAQKQNKLITITGTANKNPRNNRWQLDDVSSISILNEQINL